LSEPEVLFLHGAGGGGWEWNIWMRVFRAHGYTVHAPDLLPSAKGLSNTSLEDYREQVHRHLLAMNAPKVIIGASLGGLLAMMNSELADALILINAMPPAPLHRRMPAHEVYPGIIPWQSQASLSGTRRSLFDCDDMTCLFAFRHWRNESGAVMNAAMAGIDVDMGKPMCPVMVMASEQDADIPFSLTKALAESMDAQFVHLAETSHVGPLLGKTAGQCAMQAVNYLNTHFQQGKIQTRHIGFSAFCRSAVDASNCA